MPVARIITSTPEQALALAERLRRSGYTVEMLGPDDVPSSPADIELRLSAGRASQVLKEIATRLAGADSEVYIAAGALRSRPISVRSSSANPGVPSITDTMNGVAAGLQNKRDLLARALREQRLLLRQERNAERQRVRHERGPAPAEVVTNNSFPPASQPLDQSEVVRLEQPAPAIEVASEIRLPEPLAQADDATRSINEPDALSDLQVPPIASPEPLRSVEKEARTERPHEIVPAVLENVSKHDRAEPRIQAAQPPEKVPIQLSGQRRRVVRVVVPGGRRLSRRAREWRAAVLISCLFAGVLMLGWTVVTREPVSPLPKSISAETGVEQSVPFGSATLKPAAASAIPSPQPHKTVVQSVPAVMRGRSTAKTASRAVESGGRTATHKPEHKGRVPRPTPEDDIAEDHVIYHRPLADAQAPPSEKASLKKFSD